MHQTVEFLLRYGYIVLFGTVLAEQIGLPIPAVPVILAAGALAGVGTFSLSLALTTVVVAAVASDLVWYQLGRTRGQAVLRVLCRISLEPDSCVRMTRDWFDKLGNFALVVAKFVPGLSTAAPPMAGVAKMPLSRFLVADIAGSLIWGAAFLACGFLFSRQIERVAEFALRMGSWLAVFLAGLLALYIAWKYYQRRRFLHSLRIARITPEDLKSKLDSGEEVLIVDVRSAAEVEETGKLPGAIWLDVKAIGEAHHRIARDREVVLYCACPNEAAAAKAALWLRAQGIKRVRPLEGGYDEWRKRGYPMDRGSAAVHNR
jgi:membrane protein DedA with SNARE-associated domain/rhodanese-related sulfurtransferase